MVIFASQEGQQTALAHAGTGQIVEYELPVPEGPVGLKAWVQAHKAQRPGNAVLQQQVGADRASRQREASDCVHAEQICEHLSCLPAKIDIRWQKTTTDQAFVEFVVEVIISITHTFCSQLESQMAICICLAACCTY